MKRPSIAFALNLLLDPVLGASVGNIDKERVGSFSLSPNSTVLHLDIFLLYKYTNIKDIAGQSARYRYASIFLV